MGKSRGMRRKSRSTLSKRVREKGKIPLSRLLAKYDLGDKVVIDINPTVHNGMPHKRFQGKVANIVEKRGKAYVLEIPQRKTSKLVIAAPHHIKKHQGS
jgi:large subunit ribosomal protein L21e